MTIADGTFPEGWQLGCESWSFHRQFYARVGRSTEHLEYTVLRAQIRRRIAVSLGNHRFRVTLSDGAPLIVRGGWSVLTGVETADWTPRRPPMAPASPPVELAPQAPAIAVQTPRQPLRASTLTLGNPGAAVVLAARLRRFGIPERAISQPAPP